jgi:hypothetical protein
MYLSSSGAWADSWLCEWAYGMLGCDCCDVPMTGRNPCSGSYGARTVWKLSWGLVSPSWRFHSRAWACQLGESSCALYTSLTSRLPRRDLCLKAILAWLMLVALGVRPRSRGRPDTGATFPLLT